MIRRNLARSEDLALLTDLYDDARERVERSVGPDRHKAIAAWSRERTCVEPPKTSVPQTTRSVAPRNSGAKPSRGSHEAEREPIRTHLPGPLGEGSRYRADRERRMAEGALFTARRAEQKSLRA